MFYLSLAYLKEHLVNLELLSLYENLLVAAGLTTLLIALSFLLSPAKDDKEKGSSYECGFEPFEDARTAFNVHFYIVGILFLIFDLEIAFLYPWVFSVMTPYGVAIPNFLGIFFFLTALAIGFVYEWRRQVLTWSPSP
jgi:NADH:ubiquinone oxidoreductase subunit 3 (subunit A)